MASITHQRCFNHGQREAVARCPECGQCYCRECITEHDDRVICASCLAKLSHALPKRQRAFIRLARGAVALAAFVALWFFFYLVGQSLLGIPSTFHEGTLWQP